MSNKNKIVLVTGGAGFIGSHLVEELLKNGHNVVSLDNYFTGSEKNHIAGVRYIKGFTGGIGEVLKENSIDLPYVIYHLGEYSRVLTSFTDVRLVNLFNVVGTRAVLDFCKKHKIKLVYAGSSTKFGDSIGDINSSPYARSKADNTEWVKNYGDWFKMPYAIVYFYNVFGKRENDSKKYGTLIAKYARAMQEGKKLIIYGKGEQRRAFTWVKDVVRGLIMVGENGVGDGFCLGPENTYSIKQIAGFFGGEIDWKAKKKGDRNSSTIDVSKMCEWFGWRTTLDVKDYIYELVGRLPSKK